MRPTSYQSMQRDKPTPSLKGKPDFLLLILTLVLTGFGIVMVFSASSSIAAVNNHDAYHFVKRQAIWAVLGFVAMLIAMNIPYRAYKKLFIPLFIVTLIMLALVPYVGGTLNGARSWFNIGPIGIQPSELAKIATVLYLAALISKKGEKFRDFKKGLFPVMIIVGVVVGLIMLQPDLGSATILTMTCGIIIIAGGANLRHIFNCILVGVLGILLVAGISMLISPEKILEGYRIDRITSWINPFLDEQNAGYNLIQSLKAIAHGGWTGAGFGQGIQKLFYLPYPYNDFIFAVIAEELGLIGTTLFLLVYAYFIWRGLLIALRCPDIYGTLVGVGIIGNIAVQAFINIGGVTRTIPITGVTLPFISYGGSSLLITMASVGILLSISRHSIRADQPKTIRSDTRTVSANKKDYRPLRPL